MMAFITDVVPKGYEFINNDDPPWRSWRHQGTDWTSMEWSVRFVYPTPSSF
jgi:hypothetical protein